MATRSLLSRLMRGVLLTVDILAAAAMLLTGYSGYVSPLQNSSWWGFMSLCFPFCLLAVVVLFVVQLFWHRRGAVLLAVAMIACGGPILTYCPLNFFTPEMPPGSEKLVVQTYNVAGFMDKRPDGSQHRNAMVDEILASGADIVCLQEATEVYLKKYNATQDQLDSLHARYPYISAGGIAQLTLSRYPLTNIHLEINRNTFPGGDLAAYRVTLPDGRLLTVFNVHLQSYRLNASDRELFLSLTELHKEDVGSVRRQLIAKLGAAARGRAREVQKLLQWIRLYGGPNVIIAGDFNDVPGCYTIRSLGDAGFRDAYPEVGLGPMVTFNDNRFYFCIDHLMYRGAIKPISVHKGTLRASDHYPLTFTLALGGE